MILRPPRMDDEDVEVAEAISSAIRTTRAHKPNNRTELDRIYAVTITELEKAYAYFVTFALPFTQTGADDEEAQPRPSTIESFVESMRELVASLKAATSDEIDPGLAAAAIAAFEHSLSCFDAIEQGSPAAQERTE